MPFLPCLLSLINQQRIFAQNQYTGKKFDDIHFLVMALCYVQKCEPSYNVLGMTQNCIPPSGLVKHLVDEGSKIEYYPSFYGQPV